MLTIDQQVLTIEQALKLARQHHNSGQLPQAESIYKKVLHTDPGQPTALHLLGVVAHQVGKDDIAVDHITKALAVEPDNADAHNNLGATLQEQEKLDDAIARFREAITNDPNYADAHYNLGAMLQDVGKLDESTACYRKVLDIDPGYAQAHNNLGVALQDQGSLDEALASYGTALTLNSDYTHARYNKGLTLLLAGRLDEGWDDYAWRWFAKLGLTRMDVPATVWAGENVAGKTVLIYAEQMSGDIIQFPRYIPLVAARGARVLIVVPKGLRQVLRDLEGVDAFIDSMAQVDHVDYHAEILDLPGIFRTSLENIPICASPFQPHDVLKVMWGERIAPYGGFCVGLVWAGDPKHVNDHSRSMDASYMNSLAEIVRCISV